jgi:hydrogenase expression/formation protein HypD
LEALALARRHPDRQVVFLAVGFETTAPATALLVRQAMASGAALPSSASPSSLSALTPELQAMVLRIVQEELEHLR